MYKLNKGAKGLCISKDAKDGFKEILLQKASQEQLEFLFERGVAGIEKVASKKKK